MTRNRPINFGTVYKSATIRNYPLLYNLLSTDAMMHVLVCIDDTGPAYFSSLQKILDINGNALAWNLRKLVRKGYVDREYKIKTGKSGNIIYQKIVWKKPENIIYQITKKGRKAVEKYFGP